jgi:lipopolysaccharide transport system permease protein
MTCGIAMIEKIKELIKYRELLMKISLREIKVRYKQSVLGILWSILQPLLMMLIFTIIFSKIGKFSSDGIPYPLFAYTALLPWTFFATSLSFAIPSLVSNSNLLTKIYFPREIFPISSILAAFVDFGIAASIFIVILFYYEVHIAFTVLYIIPILFLQIMLTLAVSLFASAINVYYRDVKYALPFFIQCWMYLSPVIYSESSVPDGFRNLYMLNPMAPIISGYRNVLLKGASPDFYYLGIAAIVIFIMLFLSYKYFKMVEMSFADRI